VEAISSVGGLGGEVDAPTKVKSYEISCIGKVHQSCHVENSSHIHQVKALGQ
jgi:hypothetical protein